MFLADFHVHSNFSDGKLPIPAVIDFYGKRGFGAIAITDHLCEKLTIPGKVSAYLGCSLTLSTMPLYIEILKTEAERAWDQYRMVVIPGLEISKNSASNHRSAHILALGTTESFDCDKDVSFIADDIRAAGGISIAAHPVWTRKFEKQTFHLWDRREELKHKFDAWEVASGPYLFDEVQRSRLPLVASSDFHKPEHMSAWKTVLTCERKEAAILAAIQKQDLSFIYYEDTHDDVVRRRLHVPPLANGPGPHRVGNLVLPQAV